MTPITGEELDQMIADRARERIERRRESARQRYRERARQRQLETMEMKRYARDVEQLRGTPHVAVPPSYWNK